ADSPDQPADRPSTSPPAGPGSGASRTPSPDSASSPRLRDRPSDPLTRAENRRRPDTPETGSAEPPWPAEPIARQGVQPKRPSTAVTPPTTTPWKSTNGGSRLSPQIPLRWPETRISPESSTTGPPRSASLPGAPGPGRGRVRIGGSHRVHGGHDGRSDGTRDKPAGPTQRSGSGTVPEVGERDGRQPVTEGQRTIPAVADEAVDEFVAELGPQQFQPAEVAAVDGGRGFDLHGDDPSVGGFEDHVDFGAVAVAEVMEGRIGLGPGELTSQLVDSERLEQRAPTAVRGTGEGIDLLAAQPAGQAAVGQVQLRVALLLGGQVLRPGRDEADEIGHHEEPDVDIGGDPAETGVGVDVGADQFVAGSGGEEPEEFRELIGPPGPSQLGDVALGDDTDVVGEPGPAVAGVEAHGLGVAPGDDPLEIVDDGEATGRPVAEPLRVAEGDVDESVPAGVQFALGERPQLDEGGPPGERLGDGRDGEKVG